MTFPALHVTNQVTKVNTRGQHSRQVSGEGESGKGREKGRGTERGREGERERGKGQREWDTERGREVEGRRGKGRESEGQRNVWGGRERDKERHARFTSNNTQIHNHNHPEDRYFTS